MIPRNLLVPTGLLLAIALVMGFYLLRLQRQQLSAATPSLELQHVAPPKEAAAAEKVTLWVGHDDTGVLQTQSSEIPALSDRQERAEEVLRALLKVYAAKNSPHHIGAGAEIHAVYLVSPGVAVIDVNSSFADEQTSGILAEDLTVASFIQTLSSNVPGILRVKFLVDGKDRETLAGHADLSGLYDVAEIADLTKRLAAQ